MLHPRKLSKEPRGFGSRYPEREIIITLPKFSYNKNDNNFVTQCDFSDLYSLKNLSIAQRSVKINDLCLYIEIIFYDIQSQTSLTARHTYPHATCLPTDA